MKARRASFCWFFCSMSFISWRLAVFRSEMVRSREMDMELMLAPRSASSSRPPPVYRSWKSRRATLPATRDNSRMGRVNRREKKKTRSNETSRVTAPEISRNWLVMPTLSLIPSTEVRISMGNPLLKAPVRVIKLVFSLVSCTTVTSQEPGR